MTVTVCNQAALVPCTGGILLRVDGGDSGLKKEKTLFSGRKIQNLEPSSVAWGTFSNAVMPAMYWGNELPSYA